MVAWRVKSKVAELDNSMALGKVELKAVSSEHFWVEKWVGLRVEKTVD